MLLLSFAFAAEPTPEATPGPAPEPPPGWTSAHFGLDDLYRFPLTTRGSGDQLRIIGADGVPVPEPDALALIGHGDQVDDWHRRHTLHQWGGAACWVGGALLGAALTAKWDDAHTEWPLAVTTFVMAPVGFGVWFIQPRRNVGAWASEAEIERALLAYNRAMAETSPEVFGEEVLGEGAPAADPP